MEKYLTGDGLLKAAIIILALCWAWNLLYTALTNARKERERAEEPIRAVRGDIATLRSDLTADRERITALERDVEGYGAEMRDVHQGQTELCRGVQALLDHAIHNGNTDELQASSTSIGKWLRNR